MMVPTQNAAPIVAGGVNWAAHWRDLVEARQSANPGARDRTFDRWNAHADRFARLTEMLDPGADPFVAALRRTLRPTDSVLDVGAGAGRYAMAVAPLVASLTAVEPSRGMRDAFQQAVAARGLSNVRLVGASWQEAEVEPHDVAFCANVLYFVADAVPFIEKLDRSATRACYIFHRVEERAAVLGPLWSEVRGDRPPEPGFIELYNLLFSMGIRANAELVRAPFVPRFGTLDEAVADSRQFLGLDGDDASRDERIREALSEILVSRDGGLGYRRDTQMAIVSWEKD